MTPVERNFDRRTLLRTGTAVGAGLAITPVVGAASAGAATSDSGPGLVLPGRPGLSHGVQSGDATADSAIVCAPRSGAAYAESSS